MLRPLSIADVPTLREWGQRADMVEFFRRFPPSFQWPANDVDVLSWFPGAGAIVGPDGELEGIAQLFNIDLINRRGEFGVAIASKRERRAAIAEVALRVVIADAFSRLGLEKVYCNVLARHGSLAHILTAHGFEIDGRLRSNCFFQGEFQDELLLSILRKDWPPQTAPNKG